MSVSSVMVGCGFHRFTEEETADLVAELPLEQIGSVLRLLFTSYPYYIDRPSRKAVRKCFESFCKTEKYSEGFVKRIIPAIKNESQKPSIAASSAFVLLEWTSELFPHHAVSGDASGALFSDLLVSMVSLLDLCLGSTAKRCMKEQALRVTRRGLRTAVKGESFEAIITNMAAKLTAKASPAHKNALLLGIICGVSARLPKAKEVLTGAKKDIFAFYTREIIGSRTVVPNHISGALEDFFSNFVSGEEFETEVLPPLEKGLLRSPEILLNDVVSPLLRSLPAEIDLAKPLHEKLLKQFLSCIKSTNPVIRNGAASAFKTAVTKSKDEVVLEKVTAEILNPLKTGKVASADQRVLYAHMLDALPLSAALSNLVPTGLAGLAVKEPNEAAITAIVSTFVRHLSYGLRGDAAIDKLIMDAINKGLTDKRSTVRRTWFTKIGSMVWDMSGDAFPVFREFCQGIAGNLSDVFTEVSANPTPATQSGLIVAAYVVAAVALDRFLTWNDPKIDSLIKATDIAEACLATAPKVSFMVNPKVYSKLSSDEDHRWAIRALAATASYVIYEKSHADMWASAFLYLISTASASPKCRKEATAALATAYLKHPETIGRVILSGVWQWVKDLERGYKDAPAVLSKTGGVYLKSAIYAIALPANVASGGLEVGSVREEETVKNLLVDLTVISHHELVGMDWINLCQRSGIDPGQLSAEKASRLVNEIEMYTGLSGRSVYIMNAALKATATLAFVAPETITPLIVKLFESDLNPALLKGIGPTEVSIWRTPATGIPFVDVLMKSGPKVVEKSKDAETLKWEAELRAQLAQKKGSERKLTADEKARVEDQLAKEAIIRNRVSEIELRLSRGVGIIQHLAEGAPTAVEIWMYKAVKALLQSLEAGAGMIVQGKGIKAFLVCLLHSFVAPVRVAVADNVCVGLFRACISKTGGFEGLHWYCQSTGLGRRGNS